MDTVICCNVAGCAYHADVILAEYGNFPVCTLHDAPQTRGILDQLQRPAAYWYDGRPIVVPAGPLRAEHLAHQPTTTGCAVGEDGMLDDVPEGPSPVWPAFDLTVR